MIDLQLEANFQEASSPFVVRVEKELPSNCDSADFAVITYVDAGRHTCSSSYGNFSFYAPEGEPVEGDVLLCVPERNKVQRLFRRSSRHNTLLLTERCDQLCAMCSQPPRNSQDKWRFPHFEKAMQLVDANAVIGISGGEPTLYKDELLGIIERVSDHRPDVGYHILSNGQHFGVEDRGRLSGLHGRADITWGIPLYSHKQATHDKIVGKQGAYHRVMESLILLASTKAKIELRTVITALNIFDLPHLAKFIANHLPFVADWAIMGMEPIGYARANRETLFFDHSAFPQPLVNAAQISTLRHLPCHFYNIPRCTVPRSVRSHCVDSISDWKKKFLPICESCTERSSCSGFFEWYNQKWEWSGVRPITEGGASK